MRGLTTMLPFLRYEIERRVTAKGRLVIRVSFAGTAGSGSEGNHHGAQMRAVVEGAVGSDELCGLIIDLRRLDYEFGDWIGSCCLHARRRGCRTCLVAAGRTWECLRPLWELSGLNALVPVFQTLAQAEDYVVWDERQADLNEPPSAADRLGH
jgi:hypothetical protein